MQDIYCFSMYMFRMAETASAEKVMQTMDQENVQHHVLGDRQRYVEAGCQIASIQV